jgi:hypothetical protein
LLNPIIGTIIGFCIEYKCKIKKMKNLKLVAIILVMFFASNTMHSQVSVNVNLGVQPSWGPVGYSSVDYYYLPDVQAYYDVRSTQFIFLNGGKWIHSNRLPVQYRNYDLERGYKVVLNDYHGSAPYTQFKYHKQKYYKGYSKPQQTIGNRGRGKEKHDKYEYHGNNGHNNGEGNEGHGNQGGGKGNGHGKK